MSQPPDSHSPAEIRALVAQWVLDDGWNLAEREHPDAVWMIELTDQADRHIVVAQSKSPGDQIQIEARVVLSSEHKQQFTDLPQSSRSDFLWDLRFRLVALDIGFIGIQEPLEAVTVLSRIYLDGCTKDAFLRRVFHVKNGLFIVLWSVVRLLGVVEGVPPLPESHVN